MSDMIQYLPAIALRGTTILPDMIVHFDVSRRKSVKALEKAMVEDQRVFLITQKVPQTEDPGQEDLYKIGTIAVIKQLVKTKNGIIQVLVEGKERGELLHLDGEGHYLEAEVAAFDPSLNSALDENVKEAMLRGIKVFLMGSAPRPGGPCAAPAAPQRPAEEPARWPHLR